MTILTNSAATANHSRYPHLLFVYGTLKRGFTNYGRYLGVAEAHSKARYLGCAKTVEAYPLVVRPASTRSPVLMDLAGTGHHVDGEVYAVDATTLKAMDILEGVSTGRYYKRLASVHLCNEQHEIQAYVYFSVASAELLEQEFFQAYTVVHHVLYQPRGVQEDIVRLCSTSEDHLCNGSMDQPWILMMMTVSVDLADLFFFLKEKFSAAVAASNLLTQ